MIIIRCFSRLYSGRKVGLAVISFLARWGEIMFRIITSLVCLVNYFSLQLQLCPVGQFRTPEENLCRGVLKTFWIFWHLFYVEALNRGLPKTVFCKISVRRSIKYCLEFYIAWGRLNIFRWPFRQGHPTAIFRKISVRKTIWELEFSEYLL